MNDTALFRCSLFLAAVLSGCATEDIRLSDAAYKEMLRGNYTKAEEYLNEALAINPDNPYAVLNMGAVYQNTGRYEEARQQYARLRELQPGENAGADTDEGFRGASLLEIAEANRTDMEIAAANRALKERRERAEMLARSESAVTPSAATPAFVAAIPGEVSPGEEVSVAYSEPGRYDVRHGDTLYTVAERHDVYGDPLKWASLYRHNQDALGFLETRSDLPHHQLAAGLSLAYVTPEEAQGAALHLAGPRWAVHVASFQVSSNVVPPAVELIKRGYKVYTPEVRVDGSDWVRLRIGFFDSPSGARRVAEEIMTLLDTDESPWVVQVGPQELGRFAGY